MENPKGTIVIINEEANNDQIVRLDSLAAAAEFDTFYARNLLDLLRRIPEANFNDNEVVGILCLGVLLYSDMLDATLVQLEDQETPILKIDATELDNTHFAQISRFIKSLREKY